MDEWADLFDRAADHGVTVRAVREALADRRENRDRSGADG